MESASGMRPRQHENIRPLEIKNLIFNCLYVKDYYYPKIRITELDCAESAEKKLKSAASKPQKLGLNQVYSILYNSVSLNAESAPALDTVILPAMIPDVE